MICGTTMIQNRPIMTGTISNCPPVYADNASYNTGYNVGTTYTPVTGGSNFTHYGSTQSSSSTSSFSQSFGTSHGAEEYYYPDYNTFYSTGPYQEAYQYYPQSYGYNSCNTIGAGQQHSSPFYTYNNASSGAEQHYYPGYNYSHNNGYNSNHYTYNNHNNYNNNNCFQQQQCAPATKVCYTTCARDIQDDFGSSLETQQHAFPMQDGGVYNFGELQARGDDLVQNVLTPDVHLGLTGSENMQSHDVASNGLDEHYFSTFF